MKIGHRQRRRNAGARQRSGRCDPITAVLRCLQDDRWELSHSSRDCRAREWELGDIPCTTALCCAVVQEMVEEVEVDIFALADEAAALHGQPSLQQLEDGKGR